MIKRIYADNFRCLGNFEFRPGQLNLLLGENGSGKTSLFDVLQRIGELVVGGASAASLFANTKTMWDGRDIQSFELEIDQAGGTYIYKLEVQHSADLQAPQKPLIKKETLDFDANPLFRFLDGRVSLFKEDHSPGPQFPFKPERSFLPNLETQNGKLQSFRAYLSRINIFRLNPFAINAFSEQDQAFLFPSGLNFASWLRFMSEEHPKAKAECEKRLANMIPGFQGFIFRTMGDRKVLLVNLSREDRNDYFLAFNDLSDGQRILSMLYAIAYGLVGSASVLCFDEPENFISLTEVQPWLQCLRDLVEDRAGQVLLISHHPEVIDYLAADSTFRFERPSGDLARVSEWIPDPDKTIRPSEILIRGG